MALLEPEQDKGKPNHPRRHTLKMTEAVKRKGPSKGETQRKTAREEGSSEETRRIARNVQPSAENNTRQSTNGED